MSNISGAVIFSVSAGLGEVLISPVIAAIPSDNPDREMSKLHSTYAWGVVVAYALLAAGGGLGASVAPQLVGIVADRVSVGEFAVRLAEKISVNPEQIGIRAGILLAAIFPCLGIVMILCMKRYFKKAVR